MGTTSKMGIPYPENTDLVTNGATAMKDISNQVDLRSGFVKMIPTSATNGTVSANGDVTIGSAVSTVTVNGAFSSAFANYKILVSGGTCSVARTSLTIQLGSSTASYKSQIIYGSYNNTLTGGGPGFSNVFLWVGNALSNTLSMDCTLIGPNLAKHTKAIAAWVSDIDAGTTSAIHTVATAYTSFILGLETAATMTGGTIQVYGYN